MKLCNDCNDPIYAAHEPDDVPERCPGCAEANDEEVDGFDVLQQEAYVAGVEAGRRVDGTPVVFSGEATDALWAVLASMRGYTVRIRHGDTEREYTLVDLDGYTLIVRPWSEDDEANKRAPRLRIEFTEIDSVFVH